MIDVKPGSEKSVSYKLLFKYYKQGIFLLVIVTGLSLITIFFSHKATVANNPGTLTNKLSSSSNMALNNKGSESVDQLSSSITSAGPIKVIYELPTNQPAVYITIDDGWYPDLNVLKLMKQYHLPITTYLIEQAAQKHPDFWHEFVNAGGHIEDHTLDHPFLTHLSLADQKNQISQPIDYFRQYGPPPDELRPPYGDFNTEVGQAAKDSGIKTIVMWDAEMKNSTFSTRSGQGLKSGDIILLHWGPGLDQELIKLLNIIQKHNLGIADLSQALNGEPLKIAWLKAPIPVSNPTTSTPETTNSGKTVASGTKSASGSKVVLKNKSKT
jgi:peptidoglycan/xylan/chitin deacetylase (PgdA/CDA1 family)